MGAGGRTTDVIHTDATRIGSWEKFTFVTTSVGAVYGIETANGHYLTAVDGGGRTTDVIHSDATQVQAWEMFTLHSLGNGQYDLQTVNGHYLTAVGGGGRTTDTIHSDATRVGAWEKFTLTCGHSAGSAPAHAGASLRSGSGGGRWVRRAGRSGATAGVAGSSISPQRPARR